MKSHKHKIIKKNLETGLWGPATGCDCDISFTAFCTKGDRTLLEPIRKMASEVKKVVLLGEHPTMNPFMDDLLKEETDDFEEAINSYIRDKCDLTFHDFDIKQEIVEIDVKEMRFLMVNILPILEQEEIKITKAVALSVVQCIDIGEELK